MLIILSVLLIICAVSMVVLSWSWNKPENLKVKVMRDMNFGYLYPGASAVTVRADAPLSGTVPAQFLVTGSPWMEYKVILPDRIWINRGNSRISVSGFSTDLRDNRGRLNQFGESIFQMGATIGPIPFWIRDGSYSGRARITIYYAY